jgi:hypothetical protein
MAPWQHINGIKAEGSASAGKHFIALNTIQQGAHYWEILQRISAAVATFALQGRQS